MDWNSLPERLWIWPDSISKMGSGIYRKNDTGHDLPVYVREAKAAWQPIDTAPRDGTEFLAYDPIAGKFDVAHWAGRLSHSFTATQCDGEFGPEGHEFDGDRATHWMPLPDPPV